MKLVDLVLELRFSKDANLIEDDKRITLVKKITGGDPKLPPLKGVQLSNKETRTNVLAEPNRYAIAHQNKNVEHAIKTILTNAKQIDDSIGYHELTVARIGVKTVWLQKTKKTHEQLVNTIKSNLYTSNSLVEQASDVSLNLTLETNDSTVNYYSGPVTGRELNNHISFETGDTKTTSLLTMCDYYKLPEDTLSLDEVEQYINEAVEYGKQIASETCNVVKETIV